MPTYVTLLRFTGQGAVNLKEAPNQLDTIKQAARELGVDIKGFYLLMGQYDAVLIAEAPDDETKAKASMAVSALGNLHTETMRAFTEDEFRQLIAGLP